MLLHQVQHNVPITPPSASEASEREENLNKSAKKYSSDGVDIVMMIIMVIFFSSPKMLRMDYWHTLKAVFTNRAFVVSEYLPEFHAFLETIISH